MSSLSVQIRSMMAEWRYSGGERCRRPEKAVSPGGWQARGGESVRGAQRGFAQCFAAREVTEKAARCSEGPKTDGAGIGHNEYACAGSGMALRSARCAFHFACCVMPIVHAVQPT